MIRIIDATLREGCQSRGNRLAAATYEIALLLERAGVDMIECGHPAASEWELQRVRQLTHSALSVPVLSHARAFEGDVDAVAASGAAWVGIFIGINNVSLEARLPMRSREDVLARIRRSVAHARRCGLQVRLTVEDSSRTAEEVLFEAFDVAVESAAGRICFADTVGVLEPATTAQRIRALRARYPSTEIEVHFHDDRGLSMANALAAADAGANWISTTVNGIGERAGVTDTGVLLANLHFRGDRPLVNGELLTDLSRRVAAYARSPIEACHPLFGRDAFTHTSKLHRKAMERNEWSYSWMPPELIGRRHSMGVCGKEGNEESLISRPLALSATELRHHRQGPGTRWVMLDERLVDDCRQYCIIRTLDDDPDRQPHVDEHRHDVDSMYLVVGTADNLSGLEVEVRLGSLVKRVCSPAAVFVPAGMLHSYRYVGGKGYYVNWVGRGIYNESLLDEVKWPEPAVTSRFGTARTSSPD